MMNSIYRVLSSVFLLLLFSLPALLFAQLDAKKIASEYYQGVVKILLLDSLAEKEEAGKGYIGRGSGFVVAEDGVVFTNRHVVDMCVQGYIHYDYYDSQTGTTYPVVEPYTSELLNDSGLIRINRIGYPAPIVQVYHGKGENDYKLYYAKVLSVSMGSFDGAILRIISDLEGNPAGNIFQPLPLGNSDSTFQGEDLCVYGYPENYSGGMEMMLKEMSTLTFGKHSGFDYAYSKDFGYIKTEAAINSGNSGGPVFNQYNKVIGIATAAFDKTNIGLVGGLNAMYFVVAPQVDVLQRLSGKGLKVPKNAGAIKTVGGEKQPVISKKEIETLNIKKKAMHQARLEEIEKRKQDEAYKAFYASAARASRSRASIGILSGVNNYQRGNLDLFWQTLNNDPSLKATGNGNPLSFGGELTYWGMDKKEKNMAGICIQYLMTPKRAIAAINEYQGATNEIALKLTNVNVVFCYSRTLNEKSSGVAELGWGYYTAMKGTISAYGSTYQVKPSVPFSGGGHFSAGVNYMISKIAGVSFRAGYRLMALQEIHREDRDGYESSLSFFANSVDGETTVVKWSGVFFTTGVFLTAKQSGRKKTPPALSK